MATDTFSAFKDIPDPCSIVIFGASGDLMKRKLAPAIWHLYKQKCLPKNFAVVGVARSKMDDNSFRNYIIDTLSNTVGQINSEILESFIDQLFFIRGEPNDIETYAILRNRLEQLDKERGTLGNRCYYCSVPPIVYLDIVKQIGKAGLNHQNKNNQGWSRIILEKPFGRDRLSACELNKALHKVFLEEQIYRIDHYLGKETVQNIIAFRLANSIFEPLWNRRYIDHVQITAAENVGVEHRAGYYDQSGALRDMIQNHLLQMLCVVSMEPPSRFNAESVRIEKLKVLNSIHPFDPKELNHRAIRAQYASNHQNNRYYKGYLEEKNVPRNSCTETFAAICTTIDNWRWQDVPFYLRTGKRLPCRSTAITLQFRRPPHIIFKQNAELPPSKLTIRIQPEEGISLSFNGKIPGPDIQLGNVEMNFSYANTFGGRTPDAYETLLLDCLQGDATLYADHEWIEKSWELLTPIIEEWNSGSSKIPQYPSGTWGPKEADQLMNREWRKWEHL